MVSEDQVVVAVELTFPEVVELKDYLKKHNLFPIVVQKIEDVLLAELFKKEHKTQSKAGCPQCGEFGREYDAQTGFCVNCGEQTGKLEGL